MSKLQVVYWTLSNSSKLNVDLALFLLISTSTPILTSWLSSVVRDHMRDLEPLLQEDCVDLIARCLNAVADALR